MRTFNISVLTGAILLFIGTTFAANDVLTVGMASDLGNIDPHTATAVPTHSVLIHLMEPLVTYDENFDIKPALAESWDISEDGLTYTFRLREGVLFHNGREMVADDVIYSIDRIRDISPRASRFAQILDMQTEGDYLVRITLSDPNAAFLAALAGTHTAAILPREEVEAQGGTITRPVGTGPYRFVEYTPDRHFIMERFDEYQSNDGEPSARAGRKDAFFEQIRIVFLPDASSRVAALMAGDVEYIERVPESDVPRLEAVRSIEIHSLLSTAKGGFFFGMHENSVFSDPNLRRAVVLGLDYEELTAAATWGMGAITSSLLISSYASFYPAELGPMFERDIEEARRLVAESDYDGRDIPLLGSEDLYYIGEAAIVAAEQLRQIGLNFRVEMMSFPALVQRHTAGDFEFMAYGTSAELEPVLHFQRYLGPANTLGWHDEDVQEQIRELTRTVDEGARREIYLDLERRIRAEALMIGTFETIGISATSTAVEGFEMLPTREGLFWNVRSAE